MLKAEEVEGSRIGGMLIGVSVYFIITDTLESFDVKSG